MTGQHWYVLRNNYSEHKQFRIMFATHLSHGSKSRAKRRVCVGLGSDPFGEFGERSRSGISSVTQDDCCVVATVTDSSAFIFYFLFLKIKHRWEGNIYQQRPIAPPTVQMVVMTLSMIKDIGVHGDVLPMDWLTALMQRFSIRAWPGLLPPVWGWEHTHTHTRNGLVSGLQAVVESN